MSTTNTDAASPAQTVSLVLSMKQQDQAKGRAKKAKNMPSRPLSAYNLFFRSERERIREVIQEGNPPKDYTDNVKEAMKRVKGKTSAAEFQATASTIAKRWKELPQEERTKYEKLAENEMEKYKEKKFEYHRTLVRECAAAAKKTAQEEAVPSSNQAQLDLGEQKAAAAKPQETDFSALAFSPNSATSMSLSRMLHAGQRARAAGMGSLPGLARLSPSLLQGDLGGTAAQSLTSFDDRFLNTTPHSAAGLQSEEFARSQLVKQYDDAISSLEQRILQESLRLKAHRDERERLERQVAMLGKRYEIQQREKMLLEQQAALMGQHSSFPSSFLAHRSASFPYDDLRLQQPALAEMLRSRLGDNAFSSNGGQL